MIRAVLVFLFLSVSCFANDFEVAICAIFQNEASYIREWIEYHRLIGVDHFYLYNHNSTDHFEKVLAPYVKEGIVELTYWKEKPKNRNHWHQIQAKAYYDGARRADHKAKWIAFIDLDEFIFPAADGTLLPFLEQYEGIGAVTANWQVFGTSNIERLDSNRLMIEQLVYRAPSDNGYNRYIKSIVQTEYLDLSPSSQPSPDNMFWKAHLFPLLPGFITVNQNFEKITTISDRKIPVEKIRIHHYSFRDEEFFQAKLKRANNCKSKGRKNMLNREAAKSNEVLDESILIYADALRDAVFGG